jgi:soluble lytic murein transglycosylase-like protein
MLAAYNAGPSRVVEWSRPREGEDGKVPLSEAAFIERIRILQRALTSPRFSRAIVELKQRAPQS